MRVGAGARLSCLKWSLSLCRYSEYSLFGRAWRAQRLAWPTSTLGQPSFKAIVVAGPTSRCVFLGNIF